MSVAYGCVCVGVVCDSPKVRILHFFFFDLAERVFDQFVNQSEKKIKEKTYRISGMVRHREAFK